jgi:hypothetical protein
MMKKFLVNLANMLAIAAFAAGFVACGDNDEPTEPTVVEVTSITVTPATLPLVVGAKQTLTATVEPQDATDKTVTWSSDAPTVAEVNASTGEVTAKATGTANVTAATANGKTGTCAVTVSENVIEVTSVTVDSTTLNLKVGDKFTLEATVEPANATDKTVTWSSDAPTVAEVNASTGEVTAKAAGTANVTAATANGKTGTCAVTVTEESQEVLPIGVWTFEDVNNLVKATVGEDLISSGNFTVIDGPGNTKAVKPEANSYFTIHHNIGANGGGEYTNEYTLMMDIRGSAAEFGGWLSVFNTRQDNAGEGKLWIDGNGLIGFAALGGYSSTGLRPDTWHRVVIAAKLGESFRVYIDGAHVFTATQGYEVDGDILSLFTDVVYIGYDGAGYPGPNFAEVRMWNVQLTDGQISALGAPN